MDQSRGFLHGRSLAQNNKVDEVMLAVLISVRALLHLWDLGERGHQLDGAKNMR